MPGLLTEFKTYNKYGDFVKVVTGKAYRRGEGQMMVKNGLVIELVDIQPQVGPFVTAFVDKTQLANIS